MFLVLLLLETSSGFASQAEANGLAVAPVGVGCMGMLLSGGRAGFAKDTIK